MEENELEVSAIGKLREKMWEVKDKVEPMDKATEYGFYLSGENLEKLDKELSDLILAAGRKEHLEQELDKFERFLQERRAEEGREHYHCMNAFEGVADLIAHYEKERNKARDMLGALVEKAVVGLRAIQMVVKQCYGLTHRQQSARLDVVDAVLEETVGLMLDEKGRNWEYFDTDLFGRKDWDFRRLAAENFRLRHELEELKKAQSDHE